MKPVYLSIASSRRRPGILLQRGPSHRRGVPAAIGFLSAGLGLGEAIAFGAAAYALCVLTLLFRPETRGKVLVAID
jgi:hypothetical protein